MPEQAPADDDEILDEYSLAGGVRGKYADRFAEGAATVLPDLDNPVTIPEPAPAPPPDDR